MHQQAIGTTTFEPLMSTTATTIAVDNNGLSDHYFDRHQQVNQHLLENNNAVYYTEQYSQNCDTTFAQQHEAQQYDFENHYVNHNPNLHLHQPHPVDQSSVELDTLSFALEELGAIINSKEFCADSYNTNNNNIDNGDNNHINQIGSSSSIYKQETVEAEETEATIYENLKKMVETDHNLSNMAAPTSLTTQAASVSVPVPPTTVKPHVEIIEQPSKCALRFRYKCEGRSAGSLPGINSTSDKKSFPTIRINNYNGRAVVVISCVTKDAPYRAHPHNIVGKEGCKKGICTIVLNGNTNLDDKTKTTSTTTANKEKDENHITRTFSSLGIQCVKRKDIEDSLNLRESINVDPFRNGFQHKLDASTLDLNVVRLCFQVFIEGSTPNKCDIPLVPIVSDPIHDKKAMSDLIITKLSHCSAPATGGREVILLCDRISKDDIQIRFFEESRDGKLVWETYSDISPDDVHKQVAISFKTPKYYNEYITQPVMARIQLRRISDNQVSEPRLFQFLPCESDEDIISRKRQKIEWVNNHYALDNIFQAASSQQHQQYQEPQPTLTNNLVIKQNAYVNDR